MICKVHWSITQILTPNDAHLQHLQHFLSKKCCVEMAAPHLVPRALPLLLQPIQQLLGCEDWLWNPRWDDLQRSQLGQLLGFIFSMPHPIGPIGPIGPIPLLPFINFKHRLFYFLTKKMWQSKLDQTIHRSGIITYQQYQLCIGMRREGKEFVCATGCDTLDLLWTRSLFNCQDL